MESWFRRGVKTVSRKKYIYTFWVTKFCFTWYINENLNAPCVAFRKGKLIGLVGNQELIQLRLCNRVCARDVTTVNKTSIPIHMLQERRYKCFDIHLIWRMICKLPMMHENCAEVQNSVASCTFPTLVAGLGWKSAIRFIA